mgnify:CR=1 FL=1
MGREGTELQREVEKGEAREKTLGRKYSHLPTHTTPPPVDQKPAHSPARSFVPSNSAT